MKKIYVTTLGCPKNVVDSENLMGLLKLNKYQLCDNPNDSDVLIINTCGFINDAKEESIQAILEALQLKKADPTKKVFVAGCLSQRYREEIEYEIPEVDAIFGVEEYSEILKALGTGHAAVDNIHRTRLISTPRHYAYLKISEGCDHTCAFCAIPKIRGKHRSKPMEQIAEEAAKIAEKGIKELILVSQDTSHYGRDLYGKQSIVALLQKLESVPGLEWIRVLYWYPTNFPTEALELMRDSEKLVHYLDLPIQHISGNVLRMMRRGDTRESIIRLFAKARETVPDIALRSTVILGHPGETKEDFEELLRFVSETEFDRLGSFVYSDEDGTEAFTQSDKVPPSVAEERQRMLMELQREISLEKNRRLIGSEMKVLIDEHNADLKFYSARTYRDAPEIDNEVIIVDDKNKPLKTGEFRRVKIKDATEYELYAEIIE
ncbi:MAG: 30S ribosomal protein S12 methylthiotransferase RimO [Calditrichaeota bacterium]|nr:30S ribosomal protein S12 methylthiotransferase RimO [Calditrichota bacterium]